MRYSPEYYAKAFLSLLEEYPKEEKRITEGFIRTLAASGDLSRVDEVLEALEKTIAKREGHRRIIVRSARPLTESTLERIRSEFGKSALAANRVVPELLGGVQIIVNGETMIDTTLKRKLAALLGSA